MSIRYHQEAQSSYQDTVYQGYTDIRLGVRKEHTHTTLSADELALQRKRYAHLSDEEFRFMLQQVDGRQRTREKLPSFAAIEDWWYPVRLSCEQCSSEATARYKASLLPSQPFTLVDLTAGYGVDTYFMSEHACQAHYVERNEALCHIAEHNFAINRPQIHIHHTSAEAYIDQLPALKAQGATPMVIYIDPARRDQHGGKMVRIEDCEPNVIELLPTLSSYAESILIKLSPMLDISAAIKSLGQACEVHIVAVRNEVKEVVLSIKKAETATDRIRAINLLSNEQEADYQEWEFTQEEEKKTQCHVFQRTDSHLLAEGTYVYEPNAAIIKAGAYKLVAQQYQLCKMGVHTHLYLSDKWVPDFPGRVWQILSTDIKKEKDIRANILTRNYPLSADQLRKKLKIKDSDTHTIIGARIGDKPTLLLCKKITAVQ